MRIGEFAQLGQVSVRMLRHYESMDLLAPDSVDPFTGHRSYTVAQLPRLNRIMALNALGISLRKIAVRLDSDLSTTELTGMLNLRRHQLRAEQSAAAAKLAEVEIRLAPIRHFRDRTAVRQCCRPPRRGGDSTRSRRRNLLRRRARNRGHLRLSHGVSSGD